VVNKDGSVLELIQVKHHIKTWFFSVQHSMHWVTPKTAGRMLQSDNLVENEPVSLKTSPVNEKDVEAGYAAAAEDAEEDEAVYDPTPYNEVLIIV
jgi:hypothetical protein